MSRAKPRFNLRLSGVLKVLIVLFWLILASLLVQRIHLIPELTIPEAENLPDSEEWMSVIFKGQKIGYSYQALTWVESGYSLDQKAYLRLNLMGDIQEVRTVISAQLTKSFGLKAFSFFLAAGPVRYQLAGTLTGLDLELISATGGYQNKSRIQLKEVPRLAAALIPYLTQKGLEKGQRFKVPLFDPSTTAAREVVVVVEDKEKIPVEGRLVDTLRLRQDYADIQVFAWVDGQGRIVKQDGLLGFSLVRTTADQATAGLTGRAELTDVIVATSAPADREVNDPRRASFLKARLKGVDLKGLDLDGGRQSLQGDTVEIRKEEITRDRERRVAPADRRFKVHLMPDQFIQSDDAAVQTRARSLAGGTGPLTAVERVNDWVYKNLDKRPTMSVPNAVQTLETKVGDCNEHAVLAAALLRALGVPAKVCVGLLYFQGRFYYHAWLEVYYGQWLAIDPLLGQAPADATHIRLLTGGLNRQAELIRVIGRLEVEILAVE
ncbi:MAG: transglutaminase-like domain-containing protein [Thermodesulfobacteriota bacterium]